MSDASRQGLGALAQQIRRGAAEDEKACGSPGTVREDPQARKQIRTTLDLVDDDETSKRREGEQRIRKARHVGGRLEIEDVRRSVPSTCDLASQGRLADLARPEEGDDGSAGQEALEGSAVSVSRDHGRHDSMKIGR